MSHDEKELWKAVMVSAVHGLANGSLHTQTIAKKGREIADAAVKEFRQVHVNELD